MTVRKECINGLKYQSTDDSKRSFHSYAVFSRSRSPNYSITWYCRSPIGRFNIPVAGPGMWTWFTRPRQRWYDSMTYSRNYVMRYALVNGEVQSSIVLWDDEADLAFHSCERSEFNHSFFQFRSPCRSGWVHIHYV